MKGMLTLFLVAMVLPLSVSAGEIYGSITADGRTVKEGVGVEVASGGKTYSTKTDSSGSYRVFVPEKGNCALAVHYGGQSATVGIHSYETSARYDLALEMKEGKYSLRIK